MTHTTRLVRGSIIGASALLLPAAAQAGGIYAGDSGSQAQQRAGAFVAKADDPTALAHNPAGLLGTPGSALFIGANVLDFSLKYDRDGQYQTWPSAAQPFAGQDMPAVEHDGALQPVPLIAYALRLSPSLALAIGVHAPQGYPNRKLPETVTVAGADAPAPQRYDMVEQTSLAAMVSLGGAYRVLPNLDVGLRVSYGFGTLQARNYVWGAVNHEEDVESDGIFDADVKDTFAPTFGAGVRFRATDNLELGLAYSSQMTLDMSGSSTADLGTQLDIGGVETNIIPIEDDSAQCATGGTPDALATCIKLVIPQFAQLGARWVFRDDAGQERGDVELDVRWEDWSAASRIEVTVDGQNDQTLQDLNKAVLLHGFQDVYSVRLGGSWRFPVGGLTLEPRLGASYDTAAAPDSWQRLDLDGSARMQLAAGLGISGKSWRVDLGGAGIASPKRTAAGGDPFAKVADPMVDDTEPPVADREHPDAINPLFDEFGQKNHPINNGTYESSYLILSAGLTLWW